MKRKCLLFFATATSICNIALGGVWIVCDDDGSNPSVTKSHAFAVFAEANTALRQVGMTLDITADSIQHINRSAWNNLSTTNSNTFTQTLYDMGEVPRNGSLRIFIVSSFNGSERTGFNTRHCLVLTKNANGITLAHEICHVGGLRDIYAQRDGVSIADAGLVKAEYFDPKDWSPYYPPDLLHTNLITRLLMYGHWVPNKGDIPHGRVYGVYAPRDEEGDPLPTTKGMVPVGLQDLNRQPTHIDHD